MAEKRFLPVALSIITLPNPSNAVKEGEGKKKKKKMEIKWGPG